MEYKYISQDIARLWLFISMSLPETTHFCMRKWQ